MAVTNLEYLWDHGPTPGIDLPAQRKPEHRIEGIRILRVSGARGKTVTGERLRPMYYLDDHDEETVVRAFADAHPAFVDAKSKESFVRIFSRRGRPWKTAARAVAADLGLESHTAEGGAFDANAKHVCPACGEDIDTKIPTHLTGDCEAT